MALRWVCTLVAVVALAVFATANLVTEAVSDRTVPILANLVMIAFSGAGAVLAVVAELYRRLDSRLGVLSDFLVARFEELEAGSVDRSVGGIDEYVARPGEGGAVLPLATRGMRVRAAPGTEE